MSGVYSIFDEQTGEFLRVVHCPAFLASIQVSPGEVMFEGEVEPGQCYLLDGVIQQYTPEQIALKAAGPGEEDLRWSNDVMGWVPFR